MTNFMLEIKDLHKYFIIPSRGTIKAVNGANFGIQHGESFGLIGESACGKTTLAKLIIRLYKPQKGTVLFQGRDIHKFGTKESRLYHKKVQMIFQNPETALNPRFTVERILRDPLEIYNFTSRQIKERVEELMKLVDLDKSKYHTYPHQLSGGQRQRVTIARALALEPELLIADEPFTSQDIRRQQQIADIFYKLMKNRNLTLLFIAHDLTLVQNFCRRTAVMCGGCIVEIAPSHILYSKPRHPYTKTLLEAATFKKSLYITSKSLTDILVNSSNPAPGCSFYSQCPKASNVCYIENPTMKHINDEHLIACHYPLKY